MQSVYGFIHCTPLDLHDRICYLNNLHGFASLLDAHASGVYAQFLDFLTHPIENTAFLTDVIERIARLLGFSLRYSYIHPYR